MVGNNSTFLEGAMQKPNLDDNPQRLGLDIYKQVNLPLVQERIFGELAGRDAVIYNRVWTYLEGSMMFAASALQAIAFLVKDVALTVIALLPAIISSDARRFVELHAAHALQDLVAIPVGMAGFVSPHAGTFLAKSAINIFITLFQKGAEETEGDFNAEMFKEVNGEHVENTALGLHLYSTLVDFATREAELKAKQAAISAAGGPLDEEAYGELDAELKALNAERKAWIKEHADQIAQAKTGPFDEMMPCVSGNDDDFDDLTGASATFGGFSGAGEAPTFKTEHSAISAAVWELVYGDGSLEEVMGLLSPHCGEDSDRIRGMLERVIAGGKGGEAKGVALHRVIQEMLPSLFVVTAPFCAEPSDSDHGDGFIGDDDGW
jgi:hypothetical protein